jgi:membrane protein required for colicin V production
LTELPQKDFWRNALLRPMAEQGVRELKPLLPDTLAAYVHVAREPSGLAPDAAQ